VFRADTEMVDTTTHCVRLTTSLAANTAPFTARYGAIDADLAQTLSEREAARVCSCYIQLGLQLKDVRSNK
jgi:hypothetical protein